MTTSCTGWCAQPEYVEDDFCSPRMITLNRDDGAAVWVTRTIIDGAATCEW